jgi:predicted ester cyclase
MLGPLRLRQQLLIHASSFQQVSLSKGQRRTARTPSRKSEDANKAIVRRFLEEVWNEGDLSLINELIDSRHVHHFGDGDFHGPEGVRRLVTSVRKTFPDFHSTIDALLSAEGGFVVVRLTMRGTHKGEGFGIPPMGKTVVYTGIDLFRISGESKKIIERWGEFDSLALMQQLGAVKLP